MKKYLFPFIALITALPLFAAKTNSGKNKAQTPQPEVVELITAEDTASYALGITMGTQIKSNLSGDDYSLELFFKGFTSAMFFDNGLMSKDSADAFLNRYQINLYNQALDSFKREQEAFLVANAESENVTVTPSGLQYRVVRMGDGAMPGANAKVGVNYAGMLITGKVFDEQLNRNNPIELEVSKVIKGFAEGLQLMPVGSKFTLYIPADLAYGERGAGDVIPPYATLIFEVELLYIVE